MPYLESLRKVLKKADRFSEFGGLRLRAYQVQVVDTIIESVVGGKGWTIAVMFPRQSGKNELQAQLEAYFLFAFMEMGAEMVKVSPTLRPQSQNAMRRLERVLKGNLLTRERWKKESGYLFRLGGSSIAFFSAAPESNIVGATASCMLEVDEAQDVTIAKYDKDIAPMAASTNATRIFWGTAWTASTLLARELETARAEEKTDGKQRAFVITADEVAREVPAYGRFVAGQVARLGRQHPLVRTQYFAETIDGEAGLFGPERRALMQGDHAAQLRPAPGQVCAFLLDVAGEDEGGGGTGAAGWAAEMLANPRRDATALTIVQVDLATLEDEGLRAPTYRVLHRRMWVGAPQTRLYGEVRALTELWAPRRLVVDATGVGAGLASFLEKALPGRVIPFTFTGASKSSLGWDFLGVCDTGRFKNPAAGDAGSPDPQTDDDTLSALFWTQASFCQYRVREGAGQTLAWGVPDGTRDPAGGELVHDDLLISAALCALLDGQEWSIAGETEIIPRRDPLDEIDREGY